MCPQAIKKVYISHAIKNSLNHSHAIQLTILKHELTVKFGTQFVFRNRIRQLEGDEPQYRSLSFSLDSEKSTFGTFENRYFIVKTPSLNMSIFRSCQNSLIFSMASRKGTTLRLLYQTKKLRNVSILLSFHTR